MKRHFLIVLVCCLVINSFGSIVEASDVWNGMYKIYAPSWIPGDYHVEVYDGKVRITLPDGHVVRGYMDTPNRMIIPEWGNAEGTREKGGPKDLVYWIYWTSGTPNRAGHAWARMTFE